MSQRILLHLCCAPCAVMCIESLRGEGFDVAGLWYNPSVHPFGEWRKRREAVVALSEMLSFPAIFIDDYDLQSNLSMLLSASTSGSRCSACYSDRLAKTARVAAEHGYELFTTSLLYSKYQNHDSIIEAANNASAAVEAKFLYRDFRPLWGRGITASKKLGLYRQRWCGCIFSEFEAEKQRELRKKA